MIPNVVLVMLGAFFVLGLLVHKMISITFFATAALGIVVVARHRLLSKMNREEKWFCAVFVLFVGVTLITTLAAGRFHPRTLPELEAVARYLLAVPVFLLVRWVKPPAWLVWGALMLGAALAGVYGLFHMVVVVQDKVRFVSGGVGHHIRFGMGSVTLAFLSLLAFEWCRGKGRLLMLLPFGAFFLGLTAAIASGARTGWIAVPGLVAGMAVVMPSRVLPASVRAGLVGFVLLLSAGAWFVPQTGVAARVMQGVENIRGYHGERGHIPSLGARLEMWKAAALIYSERPVTGVGVAGYKPTVTDMVADGKVRPIQRWRHPHNEYLHVASTRGSIGLVSLLLLLGVPGLLFWRELRRGEPEAAGFAAAGLTVVAAFGLFGLADTMSAVTFCITFYTMSVSVFYGMVRADREICSGAEEPPQECEASHKNLRHGY